MEAKVDTIFNTIFSTNNIAIVVLFILAVFLGWLVVQARRDEREDRKFLVDAINNNTRALSDLRVTIAANTGRVN